MNEKNFEYLKDNIKYQGFGEVLFGDLEAQLKRGTNEFSLPFKAQTNGKEVDATLHFKKSDSTDFYFFSKYDLRVEKEKNRESVSQTFYINKGHGITLKEGYNLLNGRAVFKELTDREDQKYKAWVQLDFGMKDPNGNFERKQFHQNYGFDIKQVLSQYPIRELQSESEKEKLVKSLEKGNVQIVTMQTAAGDRKIYLVANPQYKSLSIYGDKMQKLGKDERQELSNKIDPRELVEKVDQQQAQKKTQKAESPGDLNEPKKKSRKKGLSI